MSMWKTIAEEAESVDRNPRGLRMALRVNPALTEVDAEAEQFPRSGTLGQYIDYARAAAEAGVHELFIDLGQSPASLDERIDLAGRFIQGVRRG